MDYLGHRDFQLELLDEDESYKELTGRVRWSGRKEMSIVEGDCVDSVLQRDR